jgi:NADH dehydrogenase [ubiquinone] 1 alpha subcomplex assembly factor 7
MTKISMNLESHIKNLISVNGPIGVDQFMEVVISHYYKNNNPFGSKGDFITAPEISQMFGEIIGIWCANHWMNTGSNKFTLVEIGGGNGTLMNDLLRGTKHIPNFHQSITQIAMIEISPLLQAKQKSTINFSNIAWYNDLNELDAENCIIICNEFFDALPIKQFIKEDDGFREILVALNNDNFEFIKSSHLVHNLTKASTRSIIETSNVSLAYANSIKNKLGKGGAALIIDYGYIDPPYKSTLQALKNHKYHDALSDLGTADITALVDFKALGEVFQNSKITTQGEFLKAYGIDARAQSLIKNGANPQEITSALHRLTNPEQMGSLFKVLEAS